MQLSSLTTCGFMKITLSVYLQTDLTNLCQRLRTPATGMCAWIPRFHLGDRSELAVCCRTYTAFSSSVTANHLIQVVFQLQDVQLGGKLNSGASSVAMLNAVIFSGSFLAVGVVVFSTAQSTISPFLMFALYVI